MEEANVTMSEWEETGGVLALKGAALVMLLVWTLGANVLVLVVLKTNVRLQTVPNLLVGNLAFSDICLSIAVLPGAVLVSLTNNWPLGRICCEIWLATDILCCTASIWNMSTIGLDRYWAITSPVAYLNKRNARMAFSMITGVWLLSALISIAPFLGWKSAALRGNYILRNDSTAQCLFLDLPAYTIYSATGSFAVPTLLMFFVYYRIYKAFEEHRARQIYRQKVIRRHIESTILHEISHVLPTSDEFAKSEDDDDSELEYPRNIREEAILEEEEEEEEGETEEPAEPQRKASTLSAAKRAQTRPTILGQRGLLSRRAFQTGAEAAESNNGATAAPRQVRRVGTSGGAGGGAEGGGVGGGLTWERVQRHARRKERSQLVREGRRHSARRPATISAAKERRGVRVLGIILGCYTVCWTPFFFMYVLGQFCEICRPNIHIEQFITWLGYSNSAANPIIYTVFNRDYQNALKRLFTGNKR